MNRHRQPYYLVIGLGASGLSMARFLHSTGEKVIVTDIDPAAEPNAGICRSLGIKTQIGFHDQDTFNNAGALVPSPGIPLTIPYIVNARKAGVPVTGELDIFSAHNTLPVIAVTGTNGKTTTTTLIGQLLAHCGKCPFVGGNIGTPLVEQLMGNHPNDIIAAEISSFQLDISAHFKPDIGVLLNISEDHLDRYDTFDAYAGSKWRLFTNQGADGIAVVNRDIPDFHEKTRSIPAETVLSFSAASAGASARISRTAIDIDFYSRHYRIETSGLHQLHGTHNHENLAAAVLACLAAGCRFEDLLDGIREFKNLPHRMEWVARIDGISFYNDSKATNTDAVVRALECFDNNVLLILGGREKGTDFRQLEDSVRRHVKTVIAIGESRSHLKAVFDTVCDVVEVHTMAEAIRTGFKAALPGDTVLLSPACASFDMYESYAHRGDDFKSIVKQIEESHHG